MSITQGYENWRKTFDGELPQTLNMAAEACADWARAEPDRLAILDRSGPDPEDISYSKLWEMASALAQALAENGVRPGDRVGILRAQSGWTAAAHIAVWALGGISMPLFVLFGPEALATRLENSSTRVVVTDAEGAARLSALAGEVPRLDRVIVPETGLPPGEVVLAETAPEDPAVLIYTSGTTGAPKGALHGHRMLRGHLPGVTMAYDLLPQPGDVLWTPADWAWIGGLFDVLMPGLHLGVPVVASRLPKFTVQACRNLIAETGANCLFLPPTALRRLKAEGAVIPGLRAVCSGGEPLGAELLDWGRQALGVTINEIYGQTECNLTIGSCAALFPSRSGFLGKPVPGQEVAVIDRDPAGEGDIAVRRGSAAMMLGYWQNPQATEAKFRGDWMLTGDRGIETDGYIRFLGRDDDVITSAGYRIGPAEIEDCLIRHHSVASAGVVGAPDPERTERVCAFVVLKEGFTGDDALKATLSAHVKEKLAAYEYPREIHFVEELPMTVTGKIRRRDLRERLAAS